MLLQNIKVYFFCAQEAYSLSLSVTELILISLGSRQLFLCSYQIVKADTGLVEGCLSVDTLYLKKEPKITDNFFQISIKKGLLYSFQ